MTRQHGESWYARRRGMAQRRSRHPRMEPGESPIGSVGRSIVAQLDRVTAELEDSVQEPEEAVRHARKAIKRVRGLLRLIREDAGRDAFRSLNRNMRDAGRALAGLRDAVVRVQTFDAYRSRFAEHIGNDVLSVTRDCLASESASAYSDGVIQRIAGPSVIEGIEATGVVLVAWERGIGDRSAFDAGEERSVIVRGLRRTYRSGRRGLVVVTRSDDVEGFHEWRKYVKHLRYQLEHLERMQPAAIGALATSLHEVDECLGSAHDLWVLGNFIAQHPACCPDREQRNVLVGLMAEATRDLDARALRLGGPLYAEKPDVFAARIEQWAVGFGL